MMQLKIIQIDELATIAACDVFRFFQFFDRVNRSDTSAVAAVSQYRFFLVYCHKKLSGIRPLVSGPGLFFGDRTPDT